MATILKCISHIKMCEFMFISEGEFDGSEA